MRISDWSSDVCSSDLDDPRVGAVVIGPGFPAGDELLFDVEAALDSGKPLVLDAAAIDAALPRLSEAPRKAILTPHEGEFTRAFPQLYGSKIDRAKAAAARTQAVVASKGADSIHAAPQLRRGPGRTRRWTDGKSPGVA